MARWAEKGCSKAGRACSGVISISSRNSGLAGSGGCSVEGAFASLAMIEFSVTMACESADSVESCTAGFAGSAGVCSPTSLVRSGDAIILRRNGLRLRLRLFGVTLAREGASYDAISFARGAYTGRRPSASAYPRSPVGQCRASSQPG